jgi:hypothetical protein
MRTADHDQIVIEVVVAVTTVKLLFFWGGREGLELAAKYCSESLRSDRLVEAGEWGAISPPIDLFTKSVWLELEKT